MQIKVSGKGLKVTAALRDYVFTKTAKFEEFFKNIQKVEVVLEARDIDDAERRQVAEVRVWLGGLKEIQAIEGGRDMYAAIDLVMAEIIRQIKKHKQMRTTEQRRKAEKLKEIQRQAAFRAE
ncbi:ribosome-associated translation inhibitor RaiA [Candidatus Saganbacteria bacterium]|nr:ribosome-associated translation inhibitor RaiA [Candidatus Saganbacteria bacterium]